MYQYYLLRRRYITFEKFPNFQFTSGSGWFCFQFQYDAVIFPVLLKKGFLICIINLCVCFQKEGSNTEIESSFSKLKSSVLARTLILSVNCLLRYR